ncbi:MAG: tetratricopeptide repeat protein [Hyphomicrobiaceae bacterium]
MMKLAKLKTGNALIAVFAALVLASGANIFAASTVMAEQGTFSIDPKGPPPEDAPGDPGNLKSGRSAPTYDPGDRKARDRALGNLYAYLATADDAASAEKIATAIERIWLDPSSATISVLMERAIKSASAGKTDLALKLMNTVVKLMPDYAEAWNRRAFIYHMQKNPAAAMRDLQRALTIDPNHFKALDGISKVLLSAGKKKGALKALRQLREVHPFWPDIDRSIADLAREVEGQGI